MAFDVSVNRSIYAYGHGSQVYFFQYDSIMSPAQLANMSLPDRNNLTISDIRFASSVSTTLFVTVRQSDAIYRCVFSETVCTLWIAASMPFPEPGRSIQASL
jgi:hypothetical protein